MNLHLPSFDLALLSAVFVVSVALLLARRPRAASPSLRTWTLGVWLGMGALATLGSAGASLAAAAVGRVLLFASLVGMTVAVRQGFTGQALGTRERWLAGAGALVAALVVGLPLPLSGLILGGVLAMVPGAGAVFLLARWRDLPGGVRGLAAVLGLTAALALWLGVQPASAESVPWGHVLALPLLAGTVAFLIALLDRSHAGLNEQSANDEVTGCLTRRGLHPVLQHTLARSQREGQPVAFLLVTLDGMETLHKRHNPRVMDHVLHACAQRLQSRVRASDVVARYGPDTFAVVLPDTPPEAALPVAESLRAAAADQPLDLGAGASVAVTVSIGVSVSTAANRWNEAQLYQQAEAARQSAQHQGHNRVAVAPLL
jgi:diguanylate cyclase (GGDEF)-like protein